MRSLTAKLTLAFLIVGILGALMVAVLVGVRTGSEFDRFLAEQSRGRMARVLHDHYATTGSWAGIEDALNAGVPNGGAQLFNYVSVLNADGEMVAGRSVRPGEDRRPPHPDIAQPIQVDGETVGWLLLDLPRLPRMDLAAEQAFRNSVRRAIVWSGLGATVLALIVGTLLARTITRPVRELTAATETLAAGELGLQVAVRGHDEIGELAGSFNRMSSDLARAAQLRRQMTADIAHDLRTPLSVILGYTEALSDGKLQGSPQMYEVMHGEAQHLSRLIDDLRTLSLADAGELSLDCGPIAPRALLERAAATYSARADAAGVAIRVDAPDDLPPIEADPERMAQVLGNLISNALRHTGSGGHITLAAAPAGDCVALTVADTGEGIAPEDLPFVFERFYRGDQARTTDGESGLGLPIAKSLIEAHGGSIVVTNAPGVGATFEMTLPCSPPSSSTT